MSSKKNKNNGLNRQGVRDLSHIKSKSVGIVLPMPPEEEKEVVRQEPRRESNQKFYLDKNDRY